MEPEATAIPSLVSVVAAPFFFRAAAIELGDFLFAYIRHSLAKLASSMYAVIAMDGEARAS